MHSCRQQGPALKISVRNLVHPGAAPVPDGQLASQQTCQLMAMGLASIAFSGC